MNMNKKKVVVSSLAVCLIAILSLGTLAWFNDQDSVTNTFHVATSEDPTNPDDIFSVDVWEYVEDGEDDDTDPDKDDDGYKYDNIVPGGRYYKEPRVENTGAYDQWIRVHVSVSGAGAWSEVLGAGYDLSTIFEGFDADAWTRYDEPEYDETADTLTYTYYLNYKLEPGETACVFHTVVIPSQLTQYDLAKLGGDFALSISADALQADNTGATAKEAFDTCWE